jgi:hypothetical protein
VAPRESRRTDRAADPRLLGAKRSTAAKGSTVVVGGAGLDGLPQLFAQNQRLFPAGDDLVEVIRLARIQLEAASAAP